MLQATYIVLFFAVLLTALKKKRNISFTFVYLLSSALFYFNAFEGEIFVGRLNQLGVESYSIYYGTYIILIINILLTFLILLQEKENIEFVHKEEQNGENIVIKLFIVGIFVLSIYMGMKYNILTRISYNKTELANEAGSLGTYFKYLATFAAVYLYTQEGKPYSLMWKIMGTIPILSTFLYGNRSYLVITIIAIVFDKIYKNCYVKNSTLFSYLSKHKKLVMGMALLVFIVLAVKGITGALFTGNTELVIARITNPEYYKQVFYVSEPNVIICNLDTIVVNKYHIDSSSYILLWAYLLPFATGLIFNAFGFENFTYVYQRTLFGTTNRASTYLGEAYANGSYIMVAVIVLFVLSMLLLVFRGYNRCRSNVSKCTLLLIGIDTAFYLQRNSMSFQFSRIRDYLYIAILLFLIIGIVNKDHKIRL
ncbi:MAG: hypothetical protein IJI25_04970 [Eubacterium sp.]|nr:hypothetical protein [Eubacterium sp.]